MSRASVFSHETAAQLWEIPLPLALQRWLPLDVSVPHPNRAPEGKGIRGHRLQLTAPDMTFRHGLRVTSLERTVLDLAAHLDDEALLGAIDNALWCRRDVRERATLPSLQAALDRFTGRRGRGRFAALLPLATDRSDSDPESAFRLRFIRAGFPEALPNVSIYDAQGRFLATPDLQFREFRLAYDYEGDHHRTDKRQWRKDLSRVPRLQDAQWHHTRLSADDLANPTEALSRTRRLLIERGWRP